MTLLLVYVTLALGVSFLCSILEAVLLSVTPSYVANQQAQGSPSGKLLRELKRDIDRPLAAILSLNTVAHTIGAAGAGAQAQVVFGDRFVSLMSAILTLLILIVSEIIPKTLGAVYWKSLAPSVARCLPPLIVVTYPLVVLSQAFARLISKKKKGPTLDRDEFSALAHTLAKEGLFDEKEASVLRNLLRFRSLEAHHVMTPRTVVVGFDVDDTVGDVMQRTDKLSFSRFPLWDKTPDHVVGVVLKHDLMLALARGNLGTRLSELRRDVLTLPMNVKITRLLNQLLERKSHLALLVGEFGGTAGIVTLEDVVETLLGLEIVDEIDPVEDMQLLARKAWKERAKQHGVKLDE